MRIAFTVHKFPPESLGGTEIYSWSLARCLAAQGHELHVFYPLSGLVPGEAHVVRDGVHLWRVALPATRGHEGTAAQYWHTFRDMAIEAAFNAFLNQVEPDLVHFQHVQGLSAGLIRLAAGRPRVVTLHDYWYFCANSQLVRPNGRICKGPCGGWNCVDCATARADLRRLRLLWPLVALPFAYRNLYLRGALAGVNLFLAPSEFLRQQYIRHGLPAGRVRVVENGLDMARLAVDADRPLPAPAARPHFGFLGSLAWQKGVHVLIEAFNSLPEGAASLTIYGSDSAFPDYAVSLREAARHPGIRFAGAVDYQHIGAALRGLDCLVVPSLWYENSPLVIQEAYGLGVPVLASRLGALAEKVREGKTGYLFEPGDSRDLARIMCDVIECPERLSALRGRLRAAPSMTEHAKEMANSYQGLLAGLERRAVGPS